MTTAQHTALCRITAEVDAARPDREAMITHVRKAIEDAPQISTAIGWHMRMDVLDALSKLLKGWKADVKEVA
jgi:hypothetical protein